MFGVEWWTLAFCMCIGNELSFTSYICIPVADVVKSPREGSKMLVVVSPLNNNSAVPNGHRCSFKPIHYFS